MRRSDADDMESGAVRRPGGGMQHGWDDMVQAPARAEGGDGRLEDAFRAAMRRHAAGVCVLTAGAGQAVNGMAITAATSFSLEPPSVLVCINTRASLSPLLRDGALFGLAVLGPGHEAVAAAFSRRPAGRARFETGRWELPDDAPPLLSDAPVNLTCRMVHELAFGSHRALVGEVVAVRLGPDDGSLLYRDGAYA